MFWNVRGLNCLQKHGDVSNLLHQHHCGLFSLLKTRGKSCNFAKIYPRACHKWSIFTKYTQHKGGRIWMIWIPQKFEVDVIKCKAQYIHSKVRLVRTGRMFNFTMVYYFL